LLLQHIPASQRARLGEIYVSFYDPPLPFVFFVCWLMSLRSETWTSGRIGSIVWRFISR
jgi:hypothetical protein